MNLLRMTAAVEQFAARLDRPPVTAHPKRCLHTMHKAVKCDQCVQACPTGAIRIEGTPLLEAERCVGCMLCLHRCPVDVFEGGDGVNSLLSCTEKLPDHAVIELICSQHPDSAHGSSKADAAICTDGCLAALGPSAYVGLAALGVQQIVVRLDACERCSLGKLHGDIVQAVAAARDLLPPQTRIEVVDKPPRRPHSQPVISTRNPPVSRREFFQKLTAQRAPTLAQTIAETADNAPDPKHPPYERRRLLAALRLTGNLSGEKSLPEQFPSTKLQIDSSCTACGLCAKLCPTGALRFTANEDRFELRFAASDCIKCGLCTQICAAHAIHEAGTLTLIEIADSEPVLLTSGALRRCAKCGVSFASESPATLCPICEFRRRNPFGRKQTAPGTA